MILSKIGCDRNDRLIPVFLFALSLIIGSSAVYSANSGLSEASALLSLVLRLFRYLVVAVCVFVFYNARRKTDNSKVVILLIIYGIYTGLYTADNVETSFGILNTLELIVFTFFTLSEQKVIFILIKKYLVIVSILGIVAYFSALLSLGVPYTINPFYEDTSTAVYFNYHFVYLYTGDGLYRLCGLFNEPGYFGTISSLFLCADRLDLRKIGNVILFIATVLTFSLAAFVVLGVFVLFTFYKNKYVLFSFIAGVVIFTFLLFHYRDSNRAVDLLIERVEFSDGSLTGYNREGEIFENAVEKQRNDTWAYLFGYGTDAQKRFTGSASVSYKRYIYEYGLLGTLFLYSIIIIPAFKRTKKDYYAIVFVIMFIAATLQRPYMFQTLYYMTLYGGIQYVLSMKPISKKNKKRAL